MVYDKCSNKWHRRWAVLWIKKVRGIKSCKFPTNSGKFPTKEITSECKKIPILSKQWPKMKVFSPKILHFWIRNFLRKKFSNNFLASPNLWGYIASLLHSCHNATATDWSLINMVIRAETTLDIISVTYRTLNWVVHFTVYKMLQTTFSKQGEIWFTCKLQNQQSSVHTTSTFSVFWQWRCWYGNGDGI